jgi:hypothetical protein
LLSSTQVADAEPAADETELELDPVAEIPVPGGARLKTLVDAGSHWLLLDEGGRLLRAAVPSLDKPLTSSTVTFDTLVSFHAAGVSGVAADASGRYVVSGARDGAIWAHGLDANACASVRRFGGDGVTCIVDAATLGVASGAASSEAANAGGTYLLGHESGALRRVARCRDGYALTAACKPHGASIVAMCASPARDALATASSDGTLFFFALEGSAIVPRAYVALPEPPVAALWLDGGVAVAGEDGALLQVTPPLDHAHEEAGTYKAEAVIKEHAVKLPEALRPTKARKVPPAEGSKGNGAHATLCAMACRVLLLAVMLVTCQRDYVFH